MISLQEDVLEAVTPVMTPLRDFYSYISRPKARIFVVVAHFPIQLTVTTLLTMIIM